jgi:alpha-galactosidase
MREFKTQDHNISILGGEELDIGFSVSKSEEGIDLIKISMKAEEKQYFPKVQIVWSHPMIDIHSHWYPTAFRNKSLDFDWHKGFSSKCTVSAPVGCFYNLNGQNRMTYALSDALNTVQLDMGVHEEDATLNCRITLFTEPTKPMNCYEVELRIDTRDIPYHKSLEEVSKWWETFEVYKPAKVPECAKLPMYSTWYSFHQQVVPEEVEEQCRIAKELGCEAVIVDDGWQTADNNRGYAFCGDWEVSPQRIPDMKAHVARVHELGMKYILWYSVPFVGIHSKVWENFKDKLLEFEERHGTGILDPRYPDVREYLIATYEQALIDWELDGFKLDFVDKFDLSEEKVNEKDERRDYESVQEAVDRLLTDVMKRLRAIKPDIMIEFRQKYIGPLMRKYGYMFRATECPNNAITNRMETVDIRLLCRNTAAHSDMVMWNPNEPVESAALQMVNILFSVPQFSMRFDQLPKAHFKMTKFWLSFWREHRDVFLDGKFSPLYPELMYPVVEAETKEKRVIAVYSEFCVRSGENIPENFILINGTLKNEVVVHVQEDLGERKSQVYNCCGDLVKDEQISLSKGVHIFNIPAAGVMIFTK